MIRLSTARFQPRYPNRAHLNIFSAKDTTSQLLSLIAEPFESEQELYYFTDISTALQMNDGQIWVFSVAAADSHYRCAERVCFVHYDLHCKDSGDSLFGVVVPNQVSAKKKHRDKWRWKVAAFLTADQIARRYGVRGDELPRSSRQSAAFKAQLTIPGGSSDASCDARCRQQLLGVVERTPWDAVQQIKSLKRRKDGQFAKISVRIGEAHWVEAVRVALKDPLLPMAPVVVNRDNQHWIEWVQMVHLKAFGVFVGISWRRHQSSGEWTVQSVDLDSGRIHNKYKLVGLPPGNEIDKMLLDIRRQSTDVVAEMEFLSPAMPSVLHCPPTTHKQSAKSLTTLKTVDEQLIDEIVEEVFETKKSVGTQKKRGNVQNAYGTSYGVHDQLTANQSYLVSALHAVNAYTLNANQLYLDNLQRTLGQKHAQSNVQLQPYGQPQQQRVQAVHFQPSQCANFGPPHPMMQQEYMMRQQYARQQYMQYVQQPMQYTHRAQY